MNIEMTIECDACHGTGVYVGIAERDGAGVICTKCQGSGAFLYKLIYNEFTGRKTRDDVKRVYKSGYGYVIAPTVINFNGKTIDMQGEGVSYEDFCRGVMPKHIKSLACPMSSDQSACHKINGFIDQCMEIHGGLISIITKCKGQHDKAACWKRFESAQEK